MKKMTLYSEAGELLSVFADDICINGEPVSDTATLRSVFCAVTSILIERINELEDEIDRVRNDKREE